MEFKRVVLRELFESHTEQEMCDLKFVYSKIEPYWDCCKLLTDEERYRMAQIHAMLIRRTMRNYWIESHQGKIMRRLQQEEADRRGHGDPSKLYLYYPHDLVSKEYPARQEYHWTACEEDAKMIEHALKLGKNPSGYRLNSERIVHLESLVDMLNTVREKLQRRFLM